MRWQVHAPGGGCPPVFYVPPGSLEVPWTPPDRIRDLSVVKGFCAPCRRGFPRVLFCGPLGARGPFPTTFWLVCPHLAVRCAERESRGAVGRMELAMGSRLDEMRVYHLMHARLRGSLLGPWEASRVRRDPGLLRAIWGRGVGGAGFVHGFGAKCLHLHVASWLGLGYHPMASWLALEVGALECGGPGCGGESLVEG
ncbi:DUF501 domain-containing protein [Thermanaerovibrio acidaminovorans]|uniref:DUF501 domain-containing protein n=1 Tax=Thermanaerovibrio acidaminovorans (strain ATCC 49978 / DSM 6589 / Su883) TaxID=525903 RepID=D1B690_THEAS|nr:DUF501 domain-containing protein [Thermanaerovibrio acidaminovorans]ACZ19531.1 protein of unknown function DUF501 [Thermanaerovibrio acidaminovorans DSM 6589]